MAQDLKDTLQLPKTDFPMRANLVGREPARISHWEKMALYEAIQKKHADAPVFVLHDGPPFTNGDVHIGTALNKTLKDITLRYKSMRGFRTPYVPGWDCHGLPIEQKVTRELQANKEVVSTAELRKRCDQFSESWISKQSAQFKRLGVLADWNAEYKTKAPAFEADIVRTFAAFIDRGLVYRSKKPVYWSIPFETALAEMEIEYKDHISPSIWVKLSVPAEEAARFGLPTDKPLSIVIWTTTPWTLPANLAIALHPLTQYVAADLGVEYIVVAEALLSNVLAAAKIEQPAKIAKTFAGSTLENLAARHPFIDRVSRVVLADYVTTESGTGAVHTAPGHGIEDYQTGLKYGLEIYCPVGDDGRYLDDGRVPADLVGLTTLETVDDLEKKRTSPANIAVLKKLAANNALFAKQRYDHSYPHCWRSKTPIIFRAVDQWFVGLDRGGTREAALSAIDQVSWIPPSGKSRITGAVEARPDWCVSRQRSWGVPIPAFYDEKKTAYLDANVARAIADKIEKEGTNLWYDSSAAQMLEGIALPESWPAASALTAGRDTLDVWLDSGSSHLAVLRRQIGGTQWPADLYLEGSDQHRGWFQSSLWTGVIAAYGAPYKCVLTHGFIVGEDGKKISKSGQYEKPPTSDNFIAKYGADVIRLWIASQDFSKDITLSDKILNSASEAYRLLRNTLRYQLSNLFDFTPARDAVPIENLDTLDRWALHKTAELIAECTTAYDAYEFHRVYQLCSQFCAVTLSAVYHDILKDRLYTLGTNNSLRRSSQTALHEIFRALTKLLAPILTFTADEAWSFANSNTEYGDDSIHLQDWPTIPDGWTNSDVDSDVTELLKVRARVNEALEPKRQAGEIGKSLDAVVTISLVDEDPVSQILERRRDSLAEILLVSLVQLERAPSGNQRSPTVASAAGAELATVAVQKAEDLGFVRCPRCWRHVPSLETTAAYGAICPRCAESLGNSG